MYGVGVNLRLGVTEDIVEMQSNPVKMDIRGQRKCSYNWG